MTIIFSIYLLVKFTDLWSKNFIRMLLTRCTRVLTRHRTFLIASGGCSPIFPGAYPLCFEHFFSFFLDGDCAYGLFINHLVISTLNFQLQIIICYCLLNKVKKKKIPKIMILKMIFSTPFFVCFIRQK